MFGVVYSNNGQVRWDDFNTVGIVVKSAKRSYTPMFDKGAGSLLIDRCKRVAASTDIFGTAQSNNHPQELNNSNTVRIAMTSSKTSHAPIFDKYGQFIEN